MNRFFIVVWLISLCLVASGQNKKRDKYKLLWRITGHGLSSPSYLFGTMHVQDNRAFDFTDSLLLKISACNAFAMEVHPDSVTQLALAMFFQNTHKEKNVFRQLLDDVAYRKMDSLMKIRTGYPLDKFKSPVMLRRYLEDRFMKKDKQTFLDAYLYNIARKQGKIIVGLEDGKEQLALFNSYTTDDVRSLVHYLENPETSLDYSYGDFIELYYQGDIDVLRSRMKSWMDKERYDAMITDRNIKMVDNIKKEIHKQSTFIAVGAGHLPGEEGIIHLLQKEGYHVTPLQPRFTGLAKKYKYEESPQEKWFVYESEDGGYSIEMPQKPVPLKADSIPFTFQTCFDIGVPVMYLSTHISLPGDNVGRSSVEVLDAVEKNVRKTNNVQGSSKIKIQGLEAREITFLSGSDFFRAWLIHRGNYIYMLMAGLTRESAYTPEADKFFNSFRTADGKQKHWQEFTHKDGAFSVRVKGEVVSSVTHPKSAEGLQYTLNMFQSINGLTGESQLIRYNDFPVGYVSNDDSVYCSNMAQSIFTQMNGENLSQTKIAINGISGYAYSFGLPEGGIVKARMVLRGNRYYLLLTVSPSGVSSSAADDFIGSFELIPYAATQLKEFSFPEGITLQMPDNFAIDSVTQKKHLSSKQTEYNILDDKTGILYMLVVNELSRYEEANNYTAFLTSKTDEYIGAEDSVMQIQNLSDKNFQVREVNFISPKTNAIRKLKSILAGDKVYSLLAYLPVDHAQSNMPEKFFNSFSISQSDDWDLLEDKTAMLLNDLTETDTLIQKEAKIAIASHAFETADLPQVYKALETSYADDADSYFSTKNYLFRVLEKINDETTIPFIKKLYTSLPDSTSLKDNALSVLSALKNRDATLLMCNLIKADSSHRKFSTYHIFENYSDTLELLNHILPELLAHRSRFEFQYWLLDLTKMALENDVLEEHIKTNVILQVIETGHNVKVESQANGRSVDYEKSFKLTSLAEVLSVIPLTDEIKHILWKLHRSGEARVMMTTAVALLKNKISVPSSDIQKIAAEPLYRKAFYHSLEEIGMKNIFPSKYLSQQKFAESCLWEYMDYEETVPERTELLKQRKIRYNGKIQNLYVYKYKYPDDDAWYIAFSGPFALKDKVLNEQGEMTYASYDVYENSSQVEELLKNLLAEYEAELVK